MQVLCLWLCGFEIVGPKNNRRDTALYSLWRLKTCHVRTLVVIEGYATNARMNTDPEVTLLHDSCTCLRFIVNVGLSTMPVTSGFKHRSLNILEC